MPDAAWIPYRIPKDFLNKIYRTNSAWIPISFQSSLADFQQEWGRSKDIKRIDTDEHCDRPAPVRHPCIRSRIGTHFLPPYCLPTYQTSVRPVIHTARGVRALPRRGRWRFSSRRPCSRDALSPASRSLPSASWTERAWPQVPRGPRCNCARIRHFLGQSALCYMQIPLMKNC